MANGCLKVITLVEKCFISAARRFLMAMAGWKAFLLFAAVSFREQRDILNVSHTEMEPDYEAGRRNQHQEG